MIEISWKLIPLILIIILFILNRLFERDQDWGIFGVLMVILSYYSFFFYCILSIIWIFKHIKIT